MGEERGSHPLVEWSKGRIPFMPRFSLPKRLSHPSLTLSDIFSPLFSFFFRFKKSTQVCYTFASFLLFPPPSDDWEYGYYHVSDHQTEHHSTGKRRFSVKVSSDSDPPDTPEYITEERINDRLVQKTPNDHRLSRCTLPWLWSSEGWIKMMRLMFIIIIISDPHDNPIPTLITEVMWVEKRREDDASIIIIRTSNFHQKNFSLEKIYDTFSIFHFQDVEDKPPTELKSSSSSWYTMRHLLILSPQNGNQKSNITRDTSSFDLL